MFSEVFSIVICSACKGDGEVKCPKCNGTGTIPVKCDECKGTGKLTYESRIVECDICNGKGTVQSKCGECFGGGKVACEACGGTGETEEPKK
jgi:DnaJ-class molecular chaperone